MITHYNPSGSASVEWIREMASMEHEESISPAQIIDAGCVLVERQVAEDLDLSAIFRMDPEQILKALELECVS